MQQAVQVVISAELRFAVLMSYTFEVTDQPRHADVPKCREYWLPLIQQIKETMEQKIGFVEVGETEDSYWATDDIALGSGQEGAGRARVRYRHPNIPDVTIVMDCNFFQRAEDIKGCSIHSEIEGSGPIGVNTEGIIQEPETSVFVFGLNNILRFYLALHPEQKVEPVSYEGMLSEEEAWSKMPHPDVSSALADPSLYDFES